MQQARHRRPKRPQPGAHPTHPPCGSSPMVSQTEALEITPRWARMTSGRPPARPAGGRSATPAARPPSTRTFSTCARSSTRPPCFSMPGRQHRGGDREQGVDGGATGSGGQEGVQMKPAGEAGLWALAWEEALQEEALHRSSGGDIFPL